MKPTVLMKPGSSTRPRPQPTHSVLLDEDAVVSDKEDSTRRRIGSDHRRFVMFYADTGFKDPDQAARAAGFISPGIGWKLVDRLRDLIEQERAIRVLSGPMQMEEALDQLAGVARQSEDLKTKHAALRTILEIQGMLGQKIPVEDRKRLVREVEELAQLWREFKARKVQNALKTGEEVLRGLESVTSVSEKATEKASEIPAK